MIATLHHMAASGGTIVTKAIGAMPGAYILSEVHPYEPYIVSFYPHALVAQFHAQYGALEKEELDRSFLWQAQLLQARAEKDGRRLVLRDHTHFDFMVREGARKPVLRDLLHSGGFATTACLTVRNPIEVYLSMVQSDWLEGLDFDAFCGRWLELLDVYSDALCVRYEDFAASPDAELRRMCEHLGIVFDPTWQTRLNDRQFTGDSGRAGGPVAVRAAKPVPYSLVPAIQASGNFGKVVQRWPDYAEIQVDMGA